MGKEKITPNYEMLIKSKQHTDQVERTRRKRVRDSENSAPKQRKRAVPEENAINTQPRVNEENEEMKQRQTVEEVGQTENYNKRKEMDEIERSSAKENGMKRKVGKQKSYVQKQR